MLGTLVQRITFGPNEHETGLVNTLGYGGYIEHHLNHAAIPDYGMGTILAPFTTLSMTPSQLYELPPNQVATELIDATLQRAYYSKRQLFERMVEFWSDHFNIDINFAHCRWLKTVDDREVIRPHALGRFGDLLRASAHSPAMLYYLDNALSVGTAPIENYSRELFELHTLGTEVGYSQRDVYEAARCLTGWTVYPTSAGPSLSGRFLYRHEWHDPGEKRVFGHIFPAGGGQEEGETLLTMLAEHPATATRIARKLCRRFLGEGVSERIVESVASVYRSTGGDIKAMMRRVLLPQHMAQATPRYKRPMHAYISALRAARGNLLSTGVLRSQLNLAGHLPFNWGPPDGYPDANETWSGLILPRWNFAAQLAAGELPGLHLDVAGFFAGLATAEEMTARIVTLIFGGRMAPKDRDVIREYLGDDPVPLSRQREALGLALSSPGFQWY